MYDAIIIGGGVAGMTAAIYAKRGGLSVCIVEGEYLGGQAGKTYEIENYPGFTKISGAELAEKLVEQVAKNEVEIIYDVVKDVDLEKEIKEVTLQGGSLKAKTVILALGAKPKTLGIEGEKEYTGLGVSYCATCDGNFFKGKDVAVIGGGNTALEDALYLANVAKKVYLIHRRTEFRGSKILQDKVLSNSKIEFLGGFTPTKISGEKKVTTLEIEKTDTKEKSKLTLSGIFVAVGVSPNTAILADKVALDANGYVVTDERMKTDVDGVFACGDARTTPLRQIVTASADGAIAANEAIAFLNY